MVVQAQDPLEKEEVMKYSLGTFMRQDFPGMVLSHLLLRKKETKTKVQRLINANIDKELQLQKLKGPD